MATRVCTKCGVEKETTEFFRHHSVKDGIRLRGTCKQCMRKRWENDGSREYPDGKVCTVCGVYKPLSDFHKHAVCLYGVEPFCKQCKYEKRKERERNNPRQKRSIGLKALYGITIDDYETMFARQGGQCAICGRGDQKLVVDHHHATGRVRSLLCHLCNAMIGCAREQPEILQRGAAYLAAFVAG